MQNPLTDCSCIAGLIIIFILAGIFQANFTWIIGVLLLLLILVLSNWLGEMSRRAGIILSALIWICTFATVAYIILMNK
jgi:hypothetical protein